MTKRLLVTAGHSDADPGAYNPRLKLGEAALAVHLRDAVANLLRMRGLQVSEDGLDGKNQPLPLAIKLAQQSDLAVEFHFNAGQPGALGIEAFSKPEKRPFAQALCLAVASATKSRIRGSGGWKSEVESQHNRLGYVRAGGVILELEFISNDAAMVVYQANSNKVAEAIAACIANFAKG